eukprot:CAMPEP_0196578920 /NCGR_PEP_ID=MMETSP1081-20130531/13256_1 /TAXON_ID=36882 /ORGANISM="Pyramimonas amylifera, Strain CCMP720" /LENGTH=142 /DNA_ID=CAMNT_0041898317 /DNA_START=272 /DNA_END=700 /DNA_ORIENTATION=+
MKNGVLPAVNLNKNSWVPAELTKVPKGWRLGKLDEWKKSQQNFLAAAEKNFKDSAKTEKEYTESGVNRKGFTGNSVSTSLLRPSFIDTLKGMAGKWSKYVKRATVARVQEDDKGVPHASRKKINRKTITGVVRPLGARRLMH